MSPRSLPDVAKLGAKYSADMVKDRVRRPDTHDVNEVPPGEARVLPDSGTGRIGVYRDEAGEVHAVSIRCTHMGCILRFNAAETSWDCPCHGSRFGLDGAVLEGPATRPLRPVEIPLPSSAGD
jgi:Rieske Fe-S protein